MFNRSLIICIKYNLLTLQCLWGKRLWGPTALKLPATEQGEASGQRLYGAVQGPEVASAIVAFDALIPEPLLGDLVQGLVLLLPDHGVPRAGNLEHQLFLAGDGVVEVGNR